MACLRVAALLALLASAVAGCSGGDAPVPDGFVRVERPEFALAHPAGWQVTADEGTRVGITGVQQVSDVVEAAIVQVDHDHTGAFEAAVLAVVEPFRLFQVEGYEELADEAIAVTGAAAARMVDTTYDSDLLEGRIRQQHIFAIAGEQEPLVYLTVRAPEAVFDEAVAAQIRASLEVRAP